MPKCFEEDEVKLALNGLLNNSDFYMLTLLVDPHIKLNYQNEYLFLAKCLKKQYEDGAITKDRLVKLVKTECQSLMDQHVKLTGYKAYKDAGVEVEYMSFSTLLKYPISPTVFSMKGEVWCDPTLKPLPMPSLDGVLNGENRDKGRSDCIVEGDKQDYKLYYYFAQDTSKSSIRMFNKPSLTSMFGYGAYQPHPLISGRELSRPKSDASKIVDEFSQSLNSVISKSIKDGVYVWVETKGTGHTLISIFKNGKTTIYTYGRYSNNDDDGVLIIYKNQDALNYINRELFKMNASVYLIPDADEESINEYFCSLWKQGTIVEEPKGVDLASKERIKRYGRVIDKYELTSRNCTTHSLESINVKGSALFADNLMFTIPNSLDEYLKKYFSKYDKTLNFEIFYSNIYDESSKEYKEGIKDVILSSSIEGVSFMTELFEL